jgi:hypothetical protein
MKYVLVTGGVVSGLGKGVTASSIGVVLKACGLRVTSIKIGKPTAAARPFLNSPLPHRGTALPPTNLRNKARESNGGHVIAQATNARPPLPVYTHTKQKPLQHFSGLPCVRVPVSVWWFGVRA